MEKKSILSNETLMPMSFAISLVIGTFWLSSKLTDIEVLEIDKMIQSGERYKTISEKYKISLSQITSIKQRKTYKWLWNY